MNFWMIQRMLVAAMLFPVAVAQAGQESAPPADDQVDAKMDVERMLKDVADTQRARGAVRFRLASPKTEKSAWLGVSTSQVPDALRQHLKLKHKYVGVLVERVEPDSPAQAAEIQQFDIIEKVDDQWIVNTQQLSAVLRMRKPGDEVSLHIIRQGQPQIIQATLAEKDLPVLSGDDWGQWMAWQPLPGAGPFQLGGAGRIIVERGDAFDDPLLLDLARLIQQQNSTFVLKDERHTIKMETRDGQRTLIASDENGVVIFEGPLNSEEDFAAVPDEIRNKVKNLDLPGGLRFMTARPETQQEDK